MYEEQKTEITYKTRKWDQRGSEGMYKMVVYVARKGGGADSPALTHYSLFDAKISRNI